LPSLSPLCFLPPRFHGFPVWVVPTTRARVRTARNRRTDTARPLPGTATPPASTRPTTVDDSRKATNPVQDRLTRPRPATAWANARFLPAPPCPLRTGSGWRRTRSSPLHPARARRPGSRSVGPLTRFPSQTGRLFPEFGPFGPTRGFVASGPPPVSAHDGPRRGRALRGTAPAAVTARTHHHS